VTDDRLWMVRSVIRWLRDDIHLQNADRYERIMRRTRVQILGRGTAAVSGRGGGGGRSTRSRYCRNAKAGAMLQIWMGY
jgi:hypothetical protein